MEVAGPLLSEPDLQSPLGQARPISHHSFGFLSRALGCHMALTTAIQEKAFAAVLILFNLGQWRLCSPQQHQFDQRQYQRQHRLDRCGQGLRPSSHSSLLKPCIDAEAQVHELLQCVRAFSACQLIQKSNKTPSWNWSMSTTLFHYRYWQTTWKSAM